MKTDLFAFSSENGGGGKVPNALYTVSGTIYVSDSGGSPDGALVALIDSGGSTVAQTTADSGGEYTLSGVADGTYTIRVSLANYTTGTIGPFTVSGDDVTGLDLTLLRTITGQTITAALDAVKKLGSGEFLIILGQDEKDVANYDVSGFAEDEPISITIDGAKEGDGTYTVQWASGTASSAGCLTLSQANVAITLKNVTFEGPNATSKIQPLVWVKSGGTFKTQAGAVLTGNYASNGGAVYVAAGGNFVMEGGSITGNHSSGYGHGVYLGAESTMIMTGGAISGNTLKTNPDLINGICVYGAGVDLTMSADARVDRIWFYDTIVAIGVTADFSGTDTVAMLDIRSPRGGRQVLQAEAGFSGLAAVVKRFTLGYAKSSPTSDGSAITYTIGEDGKLK